MLHAQTALETDHELRFARAARLVDDRPRDGPRLQPAPPRHPPEPPPTWKAGSPGRTRTCDLAVNSRSLYQLSYRGMCLLAAEPGFEPELRDSKSLVLPLHHSAATPSTPPLTLGARSARGPRVRSWCRRPDSNRHEGYPSTVFETVASTNSATPARSGSRPRRRTRRGARPPRDGAPSAASIAAPPAPGQ